MMKPFIRQKAFSRLYSGKKEPTVSSTAAENLDVSYLNEVSCFESLRAYRGRVFCLGKHMDRLWESCDALGRRLPFSKEDMARWVRDVLQESAFRDALLRVSVHWRAQGEGRAAAIVRHFISYPDEIYEKGIELKTSVNRRWTLKAQDPQIKSSQYVTGVLAYLDLAKSTPREIIFLNQEQLVAEGTVSNLFILDSKKTVLTPPAGSGILRGVTRDVVMTLARRMGFQVVEIPLTRHEIYSASECFITNTSSEIVPVIAFDARKIGSGIPGPSTRRFLKCFRNFIKQGSEC